MTAPNPTFAHEEALAKIIRDHDQAVTETAVKETLLKRHGLRFVEDKPFAAEKSETYRQEKQDELFAELARIQKNYSRSAQELEAKITRGQVRAYSGQRLIQQYAEKTRISQEEAARELNEYATRKTANYKADFLPDRYAALLNRERLKDNDRQLAETVFNEEMAAHVTPDMKAEHDFYTRNANKSVAILANEFRGSGWAVRQQFQGKFKK